MPLPRKVNEREAARRRLALFWRTNLARIPAEARRDHLTYLHGALMEIATVYVPKFVPADHQGGTYQAMMAMIRDVATLVMANEATPAGVVRQYYVSVLPHTQQAS